MDTVRYKIYKGLHDGIVNENTEMVMLLHIYFIIISFNLTKMLFVTSFKLISGW